LLEVEIMTEEKVNEKNSEKTKETTAISENNVLVGRKPVMNYVVACITFFNSGEKIICVKARGRAITAAVDTVELLRRGFASDVKICAINIGTEELQREDGRKSNVSTIEIKLERP
jgi:DNA-binding protein